MKKTISSLSVAQVVPTDGNVPNILPEPIEMDAQSFQSLENKKSGGQMFKTRKAKK